jgi:hypothetical protein
MALPVVVKARAGHPLAGRGVNELPVPRVDPDVIALAARVKKDKIAGP